MRQGKISRFAERRATHLAEDGFAFEKIEQPALGPDRSFRIPTGSRDTEWRGTDLSRIQKVCMSAQSSRILCYLFNFKVQRPA